MDREVSPTTDEKQMRSFWRMYNELMDPQGNQTIVQAKAEKEQLI
jgi:hypothetical protein